ncbi:Ltp family lipoprotein [Agromyces sp. ZXT2-6]|uniref:Ltp family lipoprotein n=1 Tax=Agromyces sp. ZXT2-6 TaxID=3461153 RepID=UPI004055095D
MTDPQHKPGDIVNGHRLTEQPDGSLAWLPVSAEPQHKPGDIVNGHRLTEQPDGSMAWLPVEEAEPAKAKRSLKPLWIGAAIVVGLLILFPTIGNLGSSDADSVADKAPAAEQVEEEPEPEPVMVAVPDVTGQVAADAIAALTAVGFDVSYNDDLAGTVLFTTPAAGTMYAEGKTVTLTVEQKPKLTVAQENAVRSAESYLASMGFSRTGLIGQLEYEGFSTEDATFAVDNVTVDWNAEAAETAQSYMDSMAFSRQGLYDQLAYEGFTPEQIEAGLAAVGY